MIRNLLFLLIFCSTSFGSYSDMSAFKYIAFDNRRDWYVQDDELREIWLETFEKYSEQLVLAGSRGVDLASRIFDNKHPKDYENIMLLLPWWDYQQIRLGRVGSKFRDHEITFELVLAATDGSTIAKFSAIAKSRKWKIALKKAIDKTFDKLLYHYNGYDSSKIYSFPEYNKRFSNLEVIEGFNRARAIDLLESGIHNPEIEGIWKSDNYFGRMISEFLVIYSYESEAYYIINLNEDLLGLKQGTVIGSFTRYDNEYFNGYFVDCYSGRYEVGLKLYDAGLSIFQMTTREQEQKVWNLVKGYTPKLISPVNENSDYQLLENEGNYDYIGHGSGYLIPNSNIIFTNKHVINDADLIKVYFKNKDEEYTAKILMDDSDNDLAILRCPDLEITKGDIINLNVSINLGDNLGVFGFPDIENLGYNIKYTEGIINSTVGYDKANWIQMSAEIFPGSSGGPVFNKGGDLVGISVAGNSTYNNVNYAIKSSYLISFLEQYNIPYSIEKTNGKLKIKDVADRTCIIMCYQKK